MPNKQKPVANSGKIVSVSDRVDLSGLSNPDTIIRENHPPVACYPTPAPIEGREEFEKWLVSQEYPTKRHKHFPERYDWLLAGYMWDAWQASRASDRERVKELGVAAEHLGIAKQRLNAIVGEGNNILPLISRVEAMAKRLTAAESRVVELQAKITEQSRTIERWEDRDTQANKQLSTLTGLLRRVLGVCDWGEGQEMKELAAAIRSHLESSQ